MLFRSTMGAPEVPGLPPEAGVTPEVPGLPPEAGDTSKLPPPAAEAGRMKRESVEYSRKLGMLLSSKKK